MYSSIRIFCVKIPHPTWCIIGYRARVEWPVVSRQVKVSIIVTFTKSTGLVMNSRVDGCNNQNFRSWRGIYGIWWSIATGWIFQIEISTLRITLYNVLRPAASGKFVKLLFNVRSLNGYIYIFYIFWILLWIFTQAGWILKYLLSELCHTEKYCCY